jgi:hypothetical protein
VQEQFYPRGSLLSGRKNGAEDESADVGHRGAGDIESLKPKLADAGLQVDFAE